MTKPSPWGGEPERLERPTKPEWVTENELADAMFEAGEQTAEEREKKFRAARRTPSQSPDGYEVQWRPRGSDTWDGGSAGVYRTPEIAAEVEKDFAAEGHETRVRPIAYLDGSQSPYPPDTGRTHWEGCWRERGHHACAIAKLDAAPATDARVEKLRETIEVVVGFMVLAEAGSMPMAEALESAGKCARIALGEREP